MEFNEIIKLFVNIFNLKKYTFQNIGDVYISEKCQIINDKIELNSINGNYTIVIRDGLLNKMKLNEICTKYQYDMMEYFPLEYDWYTFLAKNNTNFIYINITMTCKIITYVNKKNERLTIIPTKRSRSHGYYVDLNCKINKHIRCNDMMNFLKLYIPQILYYLRNEKIKILLI